MKITALKTYHVRPRWLLLKIETDAGIDGWGEPLLEGRALTVETAVQEMGRTLVGADPTRIEHLWQRYYRGDFYRGGPVLTSALSGIEQALWDIKGKAANLPVHELLGGRVRDRIRLYGWLNIAATGDYVSEAARAVESREFTAYKFVPVPACEPLEPPRFFDEVVGTVAQLREKLGDSIDMALDFHGRCSPAVAKQLCRALEPYRPLFIEEPVLPTNPHALRVLGYLRAREPMTKSELLRGTHIEKRERDVLLEHLEAENLVRIDGKVITALSYPEFVEALYARKEFPQPVNH